MAWCRVGAGGSGGYGLLKPASEISFGQVVRIIDGPLAPLPCLSKMAYRRCEDCSGEESCAIRRVFARTHQLTTDILDRTTLADAIKGLPLVPDLAQEEVA